MAIIYENGKARKINIKDIGKGGSQPQSQGGGFGGFMDQVQSGLEGPASVVDWLFPKSAESHRVARESKGKLVNPQTGKLDFTAARNLMDTTAAGTVEGLGTPLVDQAMTRLAGKVAPVVSKIPAFKFLKPSMLKESAEQNASQIYSKLEGILATAEEQGKRVKVQPILDELMKFRSKVVERSAEFAPKAIKNVDQIIEDLTKSATKSVEGIAERLITPKKAIAIKQGLDDAIYGEAGKKLKSRGAEGIAKKRGFEITAGGLRSGLREIPGAGPLLDDYGRTKDFVRGMEDPFKGFWKGAIPGALGAGLVNPVFGMATGAPIAAMSMPYTRAILQKLLAGSMRPGGQITRAGISNLQQEGGER